MTVKITKNDQITTKFKGGGVFTKIKPLFSTDEENLFVAKQNSIIKYNKKTGKVVATYSDLKNRIVGFSLSNFGGTECVIACTKNGEIAVWDIASNRKKLYKKIKCATVKYFQVFPITENEDAEALIITENENMISIACLNIIKGKLKNVDINLHEKFNLISVDISPLKYFVVTCKQKIYFISVKNSLRLSSSKLSGKKHFTCVACHLDSEVVLTGDSLGQVIIWQNIFNNKQTQAVFHWHTLPVSCVAFSSSGSYFYSGGKESVLVRWDFNNESNKKFLPRLSGEIEHISTSTHNQNIAVSTSDNAIKILDSSFNEVKLIQHLVIGENYESGIILDPRSGALVMNGNIGQIQFYHPGHAELLYTVDVVGQNKLTNERQLTIENTRVSKIAISKSGSWIATSEDRNDLTYCYREIRLKFWKFDSEKQQFELNTCVEEPHTDSINSLQFQYISKEEELKCVSVGNDHKFKIWILSDVKKVNTFQRVWSCLFVGFYRNLPCKALSFSFDGSVMAIGFGKIVTVWTPDPCETKCSLVYPGHNQNIEMLQFGTNKECHLLVAATLSTISVWNLFTLTMVWTVSLNVEHLLADKLSTYMAAITRDKQLYIFTPSNSNPIYVNSDILKNHNIIAASFIPIPYSYDTQTEWWKHVELYFIDSNKELYSIGSKQMEEFLETRNIMEDNLITPYEKMLPAKRSGLIQDEPKKHMFEMDATHKNFKKFLEAPVHTMVPIRLTCSSLIKSLVIKKDT